MIMDEVKSVDQRNFALGNDKSETLHGNGHGSSVGTIIEPVTLQIRSGCEGGQRCIDTEK